MRPDPRFVDPVPSRLRSGRHFTYVTEPDSPQPASEPITTKADEPTMELAIEADLVRLLLEPIEPGEAPSTGFARKEAGLVALLERLSAADATRLRDRLASAQNGDALAAAFARLNAERRGRLLEHLRDAPRREFVRRARRAHVP